MSTLFKFFKLTLDSFPYVSRASCRLFEFLLKGVARRFFRDFARFTFPGIDFLTSLCLRIGLSALHSLDNVRRACHFLVHHVFLFIELPRTYFGICFWCAESVITFPSFLLFYN